MPQRFLYEFEGFQLDPVKRSLSYAGEPRPLRPTALELLLVFVENCGQTLPKGEVIKRVWGCDAGDDRNFHVTLHAVRQALRDSTQAPSIIVKDAKGYRFTTDVRVVPMETDRHSGVPTSATGAEDPNELLGFTRISRELRSVDPRSHRLHVFVASALYGGLYATALILELAYEFDRFGSTALKIAPLVFVWSMMTAIVGLTIDRKLTLQGGAGGLAASSLIFLVAAAALFGVLSNFLPAFAITKAAFQTYPAQAAYLKDVSYFIVLSLLFMILPFHYIAAIEREVQRGRYSSVLEALQGNTRSVLSSGEPYPKLWALTSVLLVFAALSLVMTAHLLENLVPGSFMNLFTELFYLRGILYFGLGIVCLWWYYGRLTAIKLLCLGGLGTDGLAKPVAQHKKHHQPTKIQNSNEA
jgi:DNA-binding winged helix-turn-helix (wHTH) protein